ncbi:NADPH-dependent codeinone reductase 1-3-like isoform X2 [Lycium barbarum]|uniref:NADPH-dependent codeinone reductase 1-3-like isoform X2 n=1 Tax=Lycium barbarum TaxID=112863 RepID=UPI00293F3CD3|nr:NADPH-dependent codeinone reductase 1-3-like isoform X2 [Lycium barbarum]
MTTDMKQMLTVPRFVLNSGHEMPLIGMGTAPTELTLPPKDQLISIFVDAIETGYRHFDTAAIYGSEEALGGAVAEALQHGLIKSREEVFITSKLWCTDTHPDLVLPALKNTLAKLGMDYLDLYLIHWPARMKKNDSEEEIKMVVKDVLPFDMKGTWEAMEECYKLGLAKSIGICNFSCTKLSQLLHHATIPPAVNQVALRWVYEQGVSVLVKSFNKDRMKENLQILDWELSNEEIVRIQEIPQCRGFKAEVFVHPDGPYKAIEEFWDGEL